MEKVVTTALFIRAGKYLDCTKLSLGCRDSTGPTLCDTVTPVRCR